MEHQPAEAAADPGNASGTPPVVELSGISKAYGHVEALREVDLELYAGEVHALVGDNGAGKSTLLKTIAGVIQPDTGEIRVQGEPVTFDSPLAARDLGIETVYQDLALADERSCTANVFMGREIVRSRPPWRWLGVLDRKEMNRRVEEAFTDLSIPIQRVQQPVRLLSGGQRQGVAITRAATWAKHVVLLDEPTAALGVRQRGAVEDFVRNLRARRFAVLLISHDIPVVLKLADKVTVLRLGRKIATRACTDVDTTWVVSAMVEEPAEQ